MTVPSLPPVGACWRKRMTMPGIFTPVNPSRCSGVAPNWSIQSFLCSSASLTFRWTCPIATPASFGAASCARADEETSSSIAPIRTRFMTSSSPGEAAAAPTSRALRREFRVRDPRERIPTDRCARATTRRSSARGARQRPVRKSLLSFADRSSSPHSRRTPAGVDTSADKARGVVRVALAGVGGDLGIRTERACAVDLGITQARRLDSLRRLAVLDPLFERGDHVEAVRSFAAAAVRHAGHHEQAIRIVDALRSTQRLHDSRVVLHAVARRDLRIPPAVILDQLSTAIEVWLQVRIQRVDRVRVELLGARRVLIERERPEIPRRILVDDVLEVFEGDRQRLRTAPRGPAELAARLETGQRAPG